jgi:hypothetical protein
MRDDLENMVAAEAAPVSENILELLTKSEVVELPSQGKYYTHPGLSSGKVEIKLMTTIHEDILSNQSYIKDGSVFERLLKSLLIDKSIDTSTLLSGDVTAILYAARGSAYGPDYKAVLTCPACFNKEEVTISLSNAEHYFESESILGNANVVDKKIHAQLTLNGKDVLFVMEFMTQKLETYFAEQIAAREAASKKNIGLGPFGLVEQLSSTITSINGTTDKFTIKQFIEDLPAKKSKELRLVYKELQPKIYNVHFCKCSKCNFEISEEVGINPDFFWPKD